LVLNVAVKVIAEDGTASVQAICSMATWRLCYKVLWEAVCSLAVWCWKISLCSWGISVFLLLCYMLWYV